MAPAGLQGPGPALQVRTGPWEEQEAPQDNKGPTVGPGMSEIQNVGAQTGSCLWFGEANGLNRKWELMTRENGCCEEEVVMSTHQSAAAQICCPHHKRGVRTRMGGGVQGGLGRHPPLSSLLTACRSAGQLLLTVMVGVAIPLLPPYTSSMFPDTGSWNTPSRGQS